MTLRPSPPQRRKRGVALAAAAVVAAFAGPALAAFGASASASHAVSSGTLQPATGVSVARGTCTAAVSTSARISWTASPSLFADGYEILTSLTSGGPYFPVGTVSGRTTTTYTHTGLLFATTYYYVVRATRNAWRSASSTQVAHTTETAFCS